MSKRASWEGAMMVRYIFCLFGMLSAISGLVADNRVVAFLNHAPLSEVGAAIEDVQKADIGLKDQLAVFSTKIDHLNAKDPGALAKKSLKHKLRHYFMPKLSGFFAIYGGYVDISNTDGLISFPLRHVSQKLYVALTPDIHLVKVKGDTLSHREFIVRDDNPVKLYLFERVERKVKDKTMVVWVVKEEKIPDDKKINPITLVIFTDPKNIVVPEGEFLAAASSHLVLPSLYVVGYVEQEKTLLRLLDYKCYFEPISVEEKKATDTTLQKLVTTI